MNLEFFSAIVCIILLLNDTVDATKCRPYSTFKVDCDECKCSSDGTQYSCTVRRCKGSPFTDNDLEFLRPKGKSLTFEPYLNDEIPPPINNEREELNDKDREESIYDLSPEFELDEEGFQDVDLEEQNASVLQDEPDRGPKRSDLFGRRYY